MRPPSLQHLSLAAIGAAVAILYGGAIHQPAGFTAHESEPSAEGAATSPDYLEAKLAEVSPAGLAPGGPGPAAAVFNLVGIRSGRAMVPRVFISALPRNHQAISEVDARKRAFITTVLPLILRANEEILAERKRLIRVHGLLVVGLDPSPADQAWLAFLGEKYRTYPYDFEELLRRVDAVSPGLALAQAAEETGWGQSRFVRGGNALFGQRTWNRGAGIVPTRRVPGATFEVLAFDRLIDSARAYALNLNRHRAYTEFRALRAAFRANGSTLDPYALAGTLDAYSERGDAYIRNIRLILRSNDLEQFEAARLAPVPSVTQVTELPPL